MTELNVVVPLSGNFSITAVGQLRLSEELYNPSHTAVGADRNYGTGEWTLSVGYVHQITSNREENPNITELARLTATSAHRFGRSSLLVRGRSRTTLQRAAIRGSCVFGPNIVGANRQPRSHLYPVRQQ